MIQPNVGDTSCVLVKRCLMRGYSLAFARGVSHPQHFRPFVQQLKSRSVYHMMNRVGREFALRSERIARTACLHSLFSCRLANVLSSRIPFSPPSSVTECTEDSQCTDVPGEICCPTKHICELPLTSQSSACGKKLVGGGG